ncbi:unnamed protein product [Gongylonema pulchrum]|uniref:Vps54_N domain-containing protein n=1 Tax=Gongylonema pulchrum TaxID=637853 RepID=A0A183F1A1_9BILA|nr:unnamed protein product [Gongylonema pulchrum]
MLQTRAASLAVDSVKESEILECIEAAYFIEEGFDATDYELKKVVAGEGLEDLGGEMEKLKQQLQVVSKRISALIVQNSPSYSAQLKDIGEMQTSLSSILSAVQNIRR